ncbi:MAG: hypothetical protein MI862_10530, partial [Desulfobacterales bacterium]|nr:hypothetical protein [Desulfobacterales bacterium]
DRTLHITSVCDLNHGHQWLMARFCKTTEILISHILILTVFLIVTRTAYGPADSAKQRFVT